MKTILLALLAIIPVLSARGESKGQAVQELIRIIRDKVPDGWVVSYKSNYSLLEVSLRKSVPGNYPVMPNQSPEMLQKLPEHERGKPSFTFRIRDGGSPAEYKRLIAENAPVLKKLKTITAELDKRQAWDKGGTYVGRTDSDKQLVEQYNALKKSLHDIPGYYFHTVSLDFEGGPGGQGIGEFTPKDEKIRDECNRVREILMKLLSKYE